LTAVTAETGSAAAKVAILVAGIKSSVRAAYIPTADQNMRPIGVKQLEIVLDEIAAARGNMKKS
jgi:hypothetical protein